ncbi:MAG: NAD-dependent protein deacylase, partial [Bacteroidaceae bacterium]|nr:NAD-dependent protein deacylase [Bacteroidaceae bacterium]
LIAQLEDDFDVSVITQNVDNLHERAGSKHVLHLHGEIMKLCSSRDKEDERYWQVLEPHQCHVESGTLAGDGSLLRPYIVFFEEAVPNYGRALQIASEADIFVVVGTSLQVTPASYIPMHVPRESQIILIDPKPVPSTNHPHELHIQQPATEGMQQLLKMIQA